MKGKQEWYKKQLDLVHVVYVHSLVLGEMEWLVCDQHLINLWYVWHKWKLYFWYIPKYSLEEWLGMNSINASGTVLKYMVVQSYIIYCHWYV